MIATLTAQHQRMSETHTRNVNYANAPLPLIPRRTSRSHSAPTPTLSLSGARIVLNSPPRDPPVGVKASERPPDDSDSSSSATSDSDRKKNNRPKRIRGVRNPLSHQLETSTALVTSPTQQTVSASCQPQRQPISTSLAKNHTSSCISQSHSLLYAPGMSLRSCIGLMKSQTTPDTHAHVGTSAQGAKATGTSMQESRPQLIRKKSGQLVKSSLKSSKSYTRGSLSIVTMASLSKSEPSTPTQSKAVHFDSKLEHVKLFLAEQKPLAVSRDGSPTDDTSGTDSDFPSFIYDEKDGKQSRKKLILHLNNMPPRIDLNADLCLEELVLSSDGVSIIGRVRVRNIAFCKWVAVRFTFDSWQTTSEVTSRYLESIDKEFDRFSFTIRLNDLLARIEEKTLLLAVRYTVDGREIWDNNHQKNYCVSFTKTRREGPSDDEASSSDMENLKTKLEKVVRGGERTGPAFAAQQGTRSADGDSALLKTGVSLASRYDFGTSLKNPWKPSDAFLPRTRMQSHPQVSPSSVPWPEKSIQRASVKQIPSLGSPRDLDDNFFHTPRVVSDFDDTAFSLPVRERGSRNHHRGYFDLKFPYTSGGVGPKCTPPGNQNEISVKEFIPPLGRHLSFPPYGSQSTTTVSSLTMSHTSYVGDTSESDLSTPSLTTPSSSRSNTPSPTEAFLISTLPSCDSGQASVSPNTHYRRFLNQFCFFTGTEDDPSFAEPIPRTQSESDIEDYLLSASPRVHHLVAFPSSPIRSPSMDSIATMKSGESSTPTTPKPLSRSPTPVTF